MVNFKREYAFWFKEGSSRICGGELLAKLPNGFKVKNSSESVIKNVHLIVPYSEGIKIVRSIKGVV